MSLVVFEVPGCFARWRLGRFVFYNLQNAGYESKASYLTSWTQTLSKLNYIHPILPPSPPLSFPPDYTHCQHPELCRHYVTHTKQSFSLQNTSANLPNSVFCLWASFRYMPLYHNANVLDVDSFSTQSNCTKGQLERKGNSRAKMRTTDMNRPLWLDRDRIQWFISEHIHGLIYIYIVCSIKHDSAWDLCYDVIILDPVTTHHISQFHPLWPHCRSKEFAFSGVVGCLPLIYGANVWRRSRPNEQLEVGQPSCLWGSSQSLQSADNMLGDGESHQRAFVLVL